MREALERSVRREGLRLPSDSGIEIGITKTPSRETQESSGKEK